jgi:hypothetical protein
VLMVGPLVELAPSSTGNSRLIRPDNLSYGLGICGLLFCPVS